MNITHHMHHDRQERLVDRHAYFYFALRVAAGMLLLLKGLYFIGNSDQLQAMLIDANAGSGANFLVSYITFAHLCGGVFIMLGLLTRFGVILQLPIVLGAIYYNIAPHALGTGAELILALVLLLMLIYIFRHGSGPVSMDRYVKTHLL